jgi:hypothetical protein
LGARRQAIWFSFAGIQEERKSNLRRGAALIVCALAHCGSTSSSFAKVRHCAWSARMGVREEFRDRFGRHASLYEIDARLVAQAHHSIEQSKRLLIEAEHLLNRRLGNPLG